MLPTDSKLSDSMFEILVRMDVVESDNASSSDILQDL